MRDINQIVATNLRFFMDRTNGVMATPTALGREAGVAANTVANMLRPEKRTVTAKKPVGYPNLDNLVKVAKALRIEVWELLHPDIARSLREREFYSRIEADFRALPGPTPGPTRPTPTIRAAK